MRSAAIALLLTTSLQAQEPIIEGPRGRILDSVTTLAQSAGFHGVVLVAQNGRPQLLKGYGIANEGRRIPFRPNTVVQIGSNVKDFTKTAVLQMVEAGRLSLLDTLGRFFPSAPADKRAITVEQLLEHQAGFPPGIGPDEEVLPLDTFLARLFARPLEFTPGTARRYSNCGYSVLAAIVQQLTGRAFDAHLDTAIFQPAGMRETGLLLPRFARDRLAHGYAGAEDRGTMLDKPHDAAGHYWNLRGNGGLISTASDMMRFYQVLRGNTLLKDPAHREMVLSTRAPSVLAGSDGVCFFLYAYSPLDNVELIIASNHAEYRAPRLQDELVAALGIDLPQRHQVVAAPAAPAVLADSGPSAVARAFIEAFNSGDTLSMRRFWEAHSDPTYPHASMAERLARYRTWYAELGKLTVIGAVQTTQGLQVTVRTASGDQGTFGFTVEPVAPYRLRGLRVEVGGS